MTENYMYKQTQNHCLQLFFRESVSNDTRKICYTMYRKYFVEIALLCMEKTIFFLFTNIISHNTYCYITYRVALLCKIPKVNVHVFSKLK